MTGASRAVNVVGRGRFMLAILVAAVAWCTVGLGRAQAATPVTATASQVADQLFVAGDVARLSVAPSGTESVVLERILQQLYAQNPALSTSEAVNDIQGLQRALSASGAPSTATLTVMPGNERVLTILDALETSNPPAPVALAITAVARDALTQSSAALVANGKYFDASADSLSTLSAAELSPARVLEATVALAASNPSFGRARDALWASTSHEQLGDGTQQLLAENPALQNDGVRALVAGLTNGSFSADETTLLSTIAGDQTQIENQTCLPGGPPPVPGSGQLPNCSGGALHDAELVAAACPNGISSPDPACQSQMNAVANDPQREANLIAANETAATAAAGLLGYADGRLQIAEQAAAQTSAQVADDENSYLTAQTIMGGVKFGEDVVSLGVNLAVSEIDPVNAISALFSVANDAIGFGLNAPDPNQIIITGIQNVSQQISDFEQYTQSAFAAISSQLAGLSGQIAQQTYALSTQLTNAQDQITQLSSAIANLQNSVDRLESEVQSLFAANANNDLSRLTTESLGFAAVNGRSLPADTFATAADDLLQDGSGTAVSQTVLAPPGPFNAFDAGSQLTLGGSDPLNTNINYFNYFPQLVSDSPFGAFTTGPLTSGCAAGANGSLCLPNPAFWASSARAFAQLLLENPQFVTSARLTQLQSLIRDGGTVRSALAKISANDAGADPGATGSKLLDGLLNYYEYWAFDQHPGGPPSLQQALLNVENAYLHGRQVPGEGVDFSNVAPWSGLGQTPDYAGLLQEPQFNNVQLCDPAFTSASGNSTLPHLSASLLGTLPNNLLNAARVGVNNITVCWTADFDNGSPGRGNYGNATVNLIFFGTIPAGFNGSPSDQRYEIGYLTTDQSVQDLYNGDGTSDAIATIAQNWQSPSGFDDVSTSLAPNPGLSPQNRITVSSYDDPQTQAILTSLQQGIYTDILAGGSSLTTGTGPDTDVMAAAQRLDGANSLLGDYVRLGFSQALASDDNLQQLIEGAKSDVFAYPGRNLFGTTQVNGVPAELIRYYQQAQNTPGIFDPAISVNGFAKAVNLRVLALRTALGSYVQTGRASGQSASDGGSLAESSPVVASTLARLRLSEDVLSDELSGALSFTNSGTATTTAPSSPAPTTSTVATPTGAPVPKVPTRLTLTVRCGARACQDRITATVIEVLRRGKVVAVGATGRLPRGATRRTIVIATMTIRLKPHKSRQVTITPNATGRTLLSRFGKLPITITVYQQQGNSKAHAIATLRRTVVRS